MPASDFFCLPTERLCLRTLTRADAPALLALYADPRVMRHWSHAPWTSLAQAHAAIAEARTDRAAGQALHLAIVTRPHGVLAGSCALFDIAPGGRRAMLGYLLAPAYWGQGLAREALQALIGHGFGRMELQRIDAEVDPGNDASQALLARLGFRLAGRLGGRWCVAGQAREVDLWTLSLCDPAA